MKKIVAAVIAFQVLLPISPTLAATISAGQKCAKANQKVTVSGKSLICTKSGSKLIWKLVAAKPAGVTPLPVTPPAPTNTTPTPVPGSNQDSAPKIDTSIKDLWVRYGWSKKSLNDVTSTSTAAFNTYVTVKRSLNQEVQVIAQDGSDQNLVNWIKSGATLVATAFEYPKLNRPFYDVVALDSTWLEKTYSGLGFTPNEVKDRLGGFNAGAPAFGGTRTNTWNSKVIVSQNLLLRDKVGMAQTAGHEFFHAVQENYAKRNPGRDGNEIPNWFWEGPAMFVGIHSAENIGAITLAEGRQQMIDRYNNGAAINRSSNLADIKANDGQIDPYALGYAASEFIVANVGMEKFINIYAQLGKGKSFADAFLYATGVQLDDFYSMFEEVRSDLGFAKR